MRDLHLPGRSTVHALNGMCATSHPLAAQAAIDILKRGGNAVDAAVAASAVLCVVEPGSTGVGGDCFVLMSKQGSGELIGLNGSGRAARAASVDGLRGQGLAEIGSDSVHSITAPGAVDAWERLLADHGTMGLADVLPAAIHYAEEGWIVAPRISVDFATAAPRLKAHAGATAIYLPGGEAPACGDVMRSPALGKTLRAIAERGRAGFYEGPVAEAMIAFLREHGSLLALEDLAATRCDYVDPIKTAYRGHELWELPPNGQGITALIMLNMLEGYDLSAFDPTGPERFHLEIEAARLAYAERDKHVADPAFVDVPTERMLSKAFADELRGQIDPARFRAGGGDAGGPVYRDTVYISVVDRDLNAVSFINSTFFSFGSAYVCPTTGVCFQNRGSSFRLDPDHPNRIEGGKRPMHTIIPGMLQKDGRPVCCFGVMGGGYQPVGHVHVATNLIDYGMDPQEAIDCARLFHQEGQTQYERGVPRETRDGLASRGHPIAEVERPFGGGQAIWIDHARGTLTGASDPRKDGAAIGW